MPAILTKPSYERVPLIRLSKLKFEVKKKHSFFQQSSNPNCENFQPIPNSDYFYYNTLYNVTDARLRNLIVNYGMPVVSVDGTMLQFYASGVLDGTECSDLNHVVSL